MRTYFIMHFDSEDSVRMLRDGEAGKLLKALYSYNCHGVLPENLKGGAAILFAQFRAQHDRDRERYQRKCETNRENIEKRWEKQEKPTAVPPEYRDLMELREAKRAMMGVDV